MGEEEREKQRESQTQSFRERQAEPRTREKHRELESRNPEGRRAGRGASSPSGSLNHCPGLMLGAELNIHLRFPTALRVMDVPQS